MKTQLWLVRALSTAILGSITSISFGQAPSDKEPGAPGAGTPAKPGPAVEEEGPFAPKGRTGKLREEEPAPAEEKEAIEAAKPGKVGADLVVGFGKVGDANLNSSVTVFSLLLGASYKVKPNISLAARVPIATGAVTPPGGAAKFNSTAFGNFELAVSYENDMGPHTKLPIELALDVPTAGGDRYSHVTDEGSRRHFAVNSAAAAGRGFEEDQLFAGHRFGVVPGAALEYGRKAIHTGAFTKVPFLLKAGGEEPDPMFNPGESVNPVAVEWVTGGKFFYSIGKVDIGARAWITYFIKDTFEKPVKAGEQGPAKLNFVVEPSVLAKFDAVRVGLGFVWPIGGRAGGDVQMNGLRLQAAYVF